MEKASSVKCKAHADKVEMLKKLCKSVNYVVMAGTVSVAMQLQSKSCSDKLARWNAAGAKDRL